MQQRVALTFDDGPWPDGTPKVLELLGERDIRATFYVWGEHALAHRQIVCDMLEAGHSVQPHCWRHTSHHRMSRGQIRADVDAVLALLRDLGAPRPHLWRPPWGSWTASTRKLANERGLALAGWTIDPTDHSGVAAKTMHEKVLADLDEAARSGYEAVILMHDCPLEPGQWKQRHDVTETIELVRRLVRDESRRFVPQTGGVASHLNRCRSNLRARPAR